jgi:hypothetical protein
VPEAERMVKLDQAIGLSLSWRHRTTTREELQNGLTPAGALWTSQACEREIGGNRGSIENG